MRGKRDLSDSGLIFVMNMKDGIENILLKRRNRID